MITPPPYPSKPIRIVVPCPPDNTSDIMSRLIGPKLPERLGQNVIVDNPQRLFKF